MAGRPPNPVKLQDLKGAYRKNPNRRPIAELPSTGDIGAPPAKWMIFYPDEGYQKAEKLRSIWDNCCKMWPWMEFADRDSLEDYCRWKLKLDEGHKISGAEISAMKSIRTELGGTGSGRARLGVHSPRAHNPGTAKKAADPRVAFMAEKCG